MGESILTPAGLAVGAVAAVGAVYSVFTDQDNSPISKATLILLAVLELGAGFGGAIYQDIGRREADNKASDAQQKLNDIQEKVGNLADLDEKIQDNNDQIQKKINDLTIFDTLCHGSYHVVSDTFQNNEASTRDFKKVEASWTGLRVGSVGIA